MSEKANLNGFESKSTIWNNYKKFLTKYWQVCNIYENAFIKARNSNYKEMADKNMSLLEDLFGVKFIDRVKSGTITAEESRSANCALADTLYTPEVSKLVQDVNIPALDELYNRNIKDFFQDKIETAEIIAKEKVALLLVRPEVFHIWEVFISFLESQNFEIIDVADKKINFKQYWSLYHHGLIVPESWEDFPTRTLGYIKNPCKAILFRDTQDRFVEPLPDAFTATFKGVRGSFTPNTLRGDIVLNELLNVQSNIDDNPNSMLVLDPIMAYRHIVSGQTPSDNAHTDYQYPFLFYAGSGVHMPNSQEMSRDMCILYSLPELKSIANRI